jgi:predicted deacetylase
VPPTKPLLCVSIHDVAPVTWPDCVRLQQALREVADIPLTWLVVPRFHGREEESVPMEAALSAAVARGDELALHGYTHLDLEPAAGGLRSRFLRGVYTQREGEFAALSEEEARRRIGLGLEWFARRGWRASGFVAPAWLLGQGAWRALRSFPFAYTTTFSRFHLLPGAGAVFSPSLVYTARNRAGRLFSPRAADVGAALLGRAPLIRLSLHPRDARYPELVRHAQHLLERLLDGHEAVTKAECARRLTSTDPSSRRASNPGPSPDSTPGSSSAPHPWC